MRSGQANAAPVASGRPQPMAPPVIWIQSLGAAAKVGTKSWRPEVTASSATMAFSGINAAIVLANASGENGPVATVAFGASGIGVSLGAPSSSARASSAATASSSGRANMCTVQSRGQSSLGLPG